VRIEFAGLFLAVAVVFSGGCASERGGVTTSAKAVKTPEARVRDRAQARWDALLKSDTDKAYAYLSPVARETMSMITYRSRINPRLWRSAMVESVVCEKETCDVKITVKMEVLNNLPVVVQGVAETWIFDQAEWWFVYTG
jgi:hypothetical protein